MPACPNCGEENPDRARFCLNCGSPLGEAPPARERKLVTVLFADVTGSTTLGEEMDPEHLKDVMSAYFDAMREEIQAEGGTVEKFIGDAVMAVFGVPKAHEDDAARALRAALRMQERLTQLNDEIFPKHGVALRARIGVNSGEVLAQLMPTPGEGMVTGDAVNVAARLEQAAEPGHILVSERTARAVRGFSFRSVGPLQLKGKLERLKAFELLGTEAGPDRGVAGLQAPMVGRDQELALLSTVFQRIAAERRPHLVTIYGDAGVGKSRLTKEFIQSVEVLEPSPLVLRGRCLPYGEGVTYWPLAEILKTYANVLDSEPPDTALEKIRTAIAETLPGELVADSDRTTAALAYTAGLEDPRLRFSQLAPRQVRLETHTAWRSFFSGLGHGAATVVVVEDIHWADHALLDLLEELADRVDGSVVFVCPARPELTERRPTWGGGKRRFSSIFLDPLSPEEADELVGFLLTVEDLPERIHQEILQRAEGNPFFLEEIIRQLIDEGGIVRTEDRWRAAKSVTDVVIPDTVQGVLAARIDLLVPEEKKTLQSAAVVGRVFWTGPVERLLNGHADEVEDILGRLESRELVLARLGSSMGGDREFIFKHILTRDVAYESLPRRERGPAHARVGRWIEETAGERRREFLEVLAYHFLEAYRAVQDDAGADPVEVAELRQKAFRYLVDACRAARTKLAVSAAVRLGEQALSIAAFDVERAEALEVLGDSYQTNYDGSHAHASLRQALDLRIRAAPEDRRAIARVSAKVLEAPTRWPGSMHRIPEHTELEPILEMGLANAGDGDSVELVQLLTAKAFWPFAFPEAALGNEDATAALEAESLAAGERAVEMAIRLGRPELASAVLDGLSSIHVSKGLYGVADEIGARRLELVPSIEDPWELADIFSTAAWNAFHLGRYREAERWADEGLRRGEGLSRGAEGAGVRLHCDAWSIVALTRLGEWNRALEGVARAEELLGDRRDRPPGFAWRLHGAAAFIHDVQGNRASADRYLAMLERVAGEQKRIFFGAGPWMATVRLRRGEFEPVRELLARYEASPTRPDLGAMYEVLCELVAAEGRWNEAPSVLDKARAHAEEAGLLALPAFANRLEGRAALAAGDVRGSVERLTSARATFLRLEARWEAACTNLSLAEAKLAAGDAGIAEKLVREAVEVFEAVRSGRELQQAGQLLSRLPG
ncbi:MAG: AAA family ATPase [Actinomycetota bacterium]|nr:AAA family ATPase [Actinomycetota bacterium]